MNPNPFSDLLHSRRFWVMILDLVVSLVLYFTGKYAAPSVNDDIKFIIGIIQPVFLLVITAITVQNNAQIKSTGNYKPPTR